MMGRTNDEWLENLKESLLYGLSDIYDIKDPAVLGAKFQELKKNFPRSEPYVLTHGDLNLTNIIVKDGKIEAIIDWETAGYMPWWAERYLSLTWTSPDALELFKPLWADIGTEMDVDTFRREIFDKLRLVINSWTRSSRSVEHPNSRTLWLRPGFCECKPYDGDFRWRDIGNQLEHKVRQH